eukprot:1189558-Prorocentrum_minimum.AAC.1
MRPLLQHFGALLGHFGSLWAARGPASERKRPPEERPGVRVRSHLVTLGHFGHFLGPSSNYFFRAQAQVGAQARALPPEEQPGVPRERAAARAHAPNAFGGAAERTRAQAPLEMAQHALLRPR